MTRIDQIKARVEAATEGPWVFKYQNWSFLVSVAEQKPIPTYHTTSTNRENAEFIAHAREDIPWLLERIKTKEVVIKRLEVKLNSSEERSVDKTLELVKLRKRIERLEGALEEILSNVSMPEKYRDYGNRVLEEK